MTTSLRDRIIDALVMSPLSDTAGTAIGPFEHAADAVLAAVDVSPGFGHSDTERIRAAFRLLLDSGDLTPMGLRILTNVLNAELAAGHPAVRWPEG